MDIERPRIAITGGAGFLGWHTAVRARALGIGEPVVLTRADFANDDVLSERLRGVSRVLHLAGVNRGPDDEVERENVALGERLASFLPDGVDVVYANSVQQDVDNPYGRGKRAAGEILRSAAGERGGRFTNVVLPNIFGEHGRPQYNSFVATFCHLIATGQAPTIVQDREVPLLHAQAAADVLLRSGDGDDREIRPDGHTATVSSVAAMLQSMAALYASGDTPRFENDFELDLFNTYRSFVFPDGYPIYPKVNADPRGRLWEVVRGHGSAGQSFVSTTVPGQTRGNHYHLRKIERFAVVQGKARIGLRRLRHSEEIYFDVSGDEPCFIDMPTMWVHNITNIGDDELLTVFWSDQLLDPENPDQFPEPVEFSRAPSEGATA